MRALNVYISILVLQFILPSNVYGETRKEVYELFYQPYKSCVESVEEYNYWRLRTGCYLSGEFLKGGGCKVDQNIENFGDFIPADINHCEILKPTVDELNIYLEDSKKD